MGCGQAKNPKGKKPDMESLRKSLRQLDSIIFKVESLNRQYLTDNNLHLNWDASFQKTSEFVQNAYDHSNNESTPTKTSFDAPIMVYDEYATRLLEIQVESREPLVNGFLLHEELQQSQKNSPILQTLLTKLILIHEFTLNLHIPLANPERYQMIIQDRLQQLVQQLSVSISMRMSLKIEEQKGHTTNSPSVKKSKFNTNNNNSMVKQDQNSKGQKNQCQQPLKQNDLSVFWTEHTKKQCIKQSTLQELTKLQK